MSIDVMKLYREFPAGGNSDRGDWLERCLQHIAAEAIKSVRPEAARITKWLRENAPDCGDNSCLFGGRGKGGMRTNGGCRCFKDVRPDMKRIFIERMWAALCVPSPQLEKP